MYFFIYILVVFKKQVNIYFIYNSIIFLYI